MGGGAVGATPPLNFHRGNALFSGLCVPGMLYPQITSKLMFNLTLNMFLLECFIHNPVQKDYGDRGDPIS